jgi:CRISPR-associated protein Csb1
MSLDLTSLDSQNRILLEVPLKPVQGHRFQPTGFPDLGAATYQAEGTACLLVESAQSMANRLEATIWDDASNAPITAANGLSYVAVNDEKGNYLTSSMMEAHRMNSPYIEKCQGDFFKKTFPTAIGVDKSRPISKVAFYAALLKYDINALLHGVFLESLDGRLRIARSISSFIEAEQVQVAASGGVKNDRIQASKEEGKTATDGFGNLPFHREEFTAEKITAYFSIDLQQIRAFGLGPDADRLLIVLALVKIRRLLDRNLRLRTACDFEVDGDGPIAARRPVGFDLPDAGNLERELAECIKKCKAKMEVTTVAFKK